MTKQRMILVSLVCFLIAAFAGQTMSQMGSSNRKPIRKMGPDPIITWDSSNKKYTIKDTKEWFHQFRQQRLRESEERFRPMEREAWKRLLRVNEQQWKMIEPKNEAYFALSHEAYVTALGSRGRDEQSFSWIKHSKGTGGIRAKTPEEMTEGQKLADELIDLLEDDKSTDEAVRQKIDALQKVRDDARRQLPKARKELAAVLTTPRQEAVFLLLGCID